MTLLELRKRPHWSFSSLNSLLNICSLQWFFQKVEKLTPEHISVNLIAGSVYHRTLDQVYLCRKLEVPFCLDEALELYTEDWRHSSRGENILYGKLDAQETEDQGRGLVRVAWENIDPAERILEVSETFCVPLSHGGRVLSNPLIGEFDLVVERDGKPMVVDWKTSAARWPKSKADQSLQATAYSLSYDLMHGVNPAVRFDIAIKNKTPVFESHITTRNRDDWNLLGTLAVKAEQLVENGFFYPSLDSFACNGCAFSGACKAWCAGLDYKQREVAA